MTDQPSFTLRHPKPGEIGWVVAAHGRLYSEVYGWDHTFEGLVAKIAGEFLERRDPSRERCWIAEMNGRPVGSVFCMRQDDTTAKLRLLIVEANAHGHGIGRALVRACMAFARDVGYTRMTLWTNDILVAARQIYEREGFRLTAEAPHHSFGVDLVGQTWERDL